MVLFHIHLTAGATATNKFRVKLSHPIPAQPMTLKKSIVRQTYNATGANTNPIIYARLGNWLSHYEITSNSGESLLPIVFAPQRDRTAEDYHIKFKADDVPTEFDVELFSDSAMTPINLGTGNNELLSVCLFFEYASNDNFV